MLFSRSRNIAPSTFPLASAVFIAFSRSITWSIVCLSLLNPAWVLLVCFFFPGSNLTFCLLLFLKFSLDERLEILVFRDFPWLFDWDDCSVFKLFWYSTFFPYFVKEG